MERYGASKISNSNKFDEDIIQKQSYKIINEDTLLKNSISNNKNNSANNNINKPNKEPINNNDEDDNINVNININNYLSKKNINKKSDSNNNNTNSLKNNQKIKKSKILLKKNNTAKNKGYLLPTSHNNLIINNKIRNLNNKKDTNDIMKSRLLARIRKQKEGLKNFDYKLQNINNNKYSINNKKDEGILLSKKEEKDENGKNQKNEKEESKHIPKILTFLRTFKNFALPLKGNNDKKDNNNSNNNNKENESNYLINPNNSCFNFSSKLKPNIGKLNLNKRNLDNINNKFRTDNNEGENSDGHEEEDFIDYNRFTFRNNFGDDDNINNINNEENNNISNNCLDNNNNKEYNDKRDNSDNDVNQIINIDEYNRRNNNNYYNNQNNNNQKNIKNIKSENNIIKNYKNKNKKIEEISSNFINKKNISKNIFQNKFAYNNNAKPYLRKKYLKNKYNSPKPEPKNKVKNNNNTLTYNNILKKNNNLNINIQSFDNYNYGNENENYNDNEDSIQSLNISRSYRKPILNTSFQRNNNFNKISKANSYYNDISVDQINLSNNYSTLNRPIKNNKIHEIIINMNDSLNSFNNERNYNTNNNLYSNRSPLKRKDFNTINNNFYSRRSPLSSKQNGGAFDLSDNYDTNQMIEDERNEIYKKRNTNYSRFMEPFQRNDNQKWYNEDSYYSFDIINMKKIAKNNNLLYQKPIKTGTNKNMNKNNSMYIKRVVHYDNKKNSFANDSDYMNDSDINNYRNRLDYTDYDAREKNVFDFDAPKAIKDSIDDISSHNTEFINDSSRENQISINSDINTNKLNISENNNVQNNGDNSNVYIKKNNNQSISGRGNQKMVYMKKLNTVYNFYQGTKKLFSKLNDKVFKHKKEVDKNIIKNKEDNKIVKNQNIINNNINKNNINSDINSSKKNDLIKYKSIITPGMKVENKIENNIPNFTKNTITPFGEEINQNIQKEEIAINKKIHNKKKYFWSKYYNFYLTKIKKNNNGSYFSKFKNYKSYKVPNKLIYYMTKEKIDIFKIPLNSKCYFQKKHIITKEKLNAIEHQKIFSFFSLIGNDNFNDNNNIMNEQIKEDENKKIMNLKQKLFTSDKQIDLLLSSDFNKIENNDNNDRYSFSFKDNKNILNSNNLSNNIINKNEINNFFFTLSPKTINYKFENQKIVPEKNNNLSIINKKENKNKINKYDYNYILSLKNNKFSKDNNLLPKNVLEHFDNLNKETDNSLFSFSLKKNINKKFKKEEIQEILKKYFTPNKKEEIKKLINKNFLTENKKIKVNTNEKLKNNINNFICTDTKSKMEWARNDLSKEIEQAEKYIKELNNKMKENTKKNDIICLLNMLTVDNLSIILNKIIELITKNNKELLSNKDIIDNEYILIKVILEKAITEKRFVNLYAKLCFELYKLLNDKIYNDISFKNILIDECKIKFNELNNLNNNSENNKINLDDEKYYLIKKKFLGNIDFICELINVNILPQDLGFYYLEELYQKYNNNNSSNEIEAIKKYLFLEAIVNFLSKFGKKINENKNINNLKTLNNFIDNNLNPVLKNEKLPGFLKYKIINLIEKKNNHWADSLYEKSILVKGKKNIKALDNKSFKLKKRVHSKKNIKSTNIDNFLVLTKANSLENNNNIYKNSINKENSNFISTNINTNNNNEDTIKLIEKDLENYETFLKENNITNKSELDKKSQIGNKYDWSMIEDILSKSNIDLGEIIRCYVEVCIDQVINNSKIYIANDYIKNIINYYSANLSNKEIDITHNKMVNLFRNIQDICIDNFNMKEIMGYLLFILIENKLNFIKDLNNFIGMDKEIIITIAEVIKFAIISSKSKSKKYHNDFKQTKLFVDNSIFNDYVTNKIQDS